MEHDKSMVNRDGSGDLEADLKRVGEKAEELLEALRESQLGQDVGKVRDKVIEILDAASTWLGKELDESRKGE